MTKYVALNDILHVRVWGIIYFSYLLGQILLICGDKLGLIMMKYAALNDKLCLRASAEFLTKPA